jgi:hypothetical protein
MIAELLPKIFEDIQKLYAPPDADDDGDSNEQKSSPPVAPAGGRGSGRGQRGAPPATTTGAPMAQAAPTPPDPKVVLTAYRDSRQDAHNSIKDAIMLLKSQISQLRPAVSGAADVLSNGRGDHPTGINASVESITNSLASDLDNVLKSLESDMSNFTGVSQQLAALIPPPAPPAPPPPPKPPTPPTQYFQTTGSKLVQMPPDEFKKKLESLVTGGVMFIDEAYQLRPERDPRGAQITDDLMDAMEVHAKSFTVIIAGYEEDIDKFLSFNRGLSGRFAPANTFIFRNYTEEELKVLYRFFIKKEGYEIESEVSLTIWAKRQGKAAALPTFANGRMVRNSVRDAIDRNTTRIAGMKNRVTYLKKHGSKLSFADVLGGCALSTLKTDYLPIQKLDGYVGATLAKRRLLDVANGVVKYMITEVTGGKATELTYHQLFYGNPGTG